MYGDCGLMGCEGIVWSGSCAFWRLDHGRQLDISPKKCYIGCYYTCTPSLSGTALYCPNPNQHRMLSSPHTLTPSRSHPNIPPYLPILLLPGSSGINLFITSSIPSFCSGFLCSFPIPNPTSEIRSSVSPAKLSSAQLERSESYS